MGSTLQNVLARAQVPKILRSTAIAELTIRKRARRMPAKLKTPSAQKAICRSRFSLAFDGSGVWANSPEPKCPEEIPHHAVPPTNSIAVRTTNSSQGIGRPRTQFCSDRRGCTLSGICKVALIEAGQAMNYLALKGDIDAPLCDCIPSDPLCDRRTAGSKYLRLMRND